MLESTCNVYWVCTGESLLLSKRLDDAVIGGTILVSGMLRFKVTHAGKEASLARIVDLIEQAQMSKAPIQRIAGRSAVCVLGV
jgi:Cu+-exporting ATPase